MPFLFSDHMKLIRDFATIIHVLSIDISIGATIMALFVSERFHLNVPGIQYVMLFQVVWSIYLADHLYDTRNKTAITARRIFFKKNAGRIFILFVLNAAVLLFHFIIWGSSKILMFSIPVALITLFYLFINWYAQLMGKVFYSKEIMIAVGYAGGVIVIPLAYMQTIEPFLWWIAAYIIMLALWNVLMIAFFEEGSNREEGQTSVGQWLSTTRINILAMLVIIIYFVLIIASGFLFELQLPAMLTWVIMGLWCLMVWIRRNEIRRQKKYLLWVDTVFILPLLYFIPLH